MVKGVESAQETQKQRKDPLKHQGISRILRYSIAGMFSLIPGDDVPGREAKMNIPLSTHMRVHQETYPNICVKTFYEEQQRNPTLTTDEYLDLLAQELNTPEKLHHYIQRSLKYTHDSPDPSNPFLKGTSDNYGNYYQSPVETILRVEQSPEGKHKMLGDCEDVAFLAQEVLRRQGKAAHVVVSPNHAFCAWMEERSDGRFNAYSIDNHVLDRNGNVYGSPIYDPAREQGYDSLSESFNAIMKKYAPSSQDGCIDRALYKLTPAMVTTLRGPRAAKIFKYRYIPISAFHPRSSFYLSYGEVLGVILMLLGPFAVRDFLRKDLPRIRRIFRKAQQFLQDQTLS